MYWLTNSCVFCSCSFVIIDLGFIVVVLFNGCIVGLFWILILGLVEFAWVGVLGWICWLLLFSLIGILGFDCGCLFWCFIGMRCV